MACRDYPHPRHLCMNFPFETASHESHCELVIMFIWQCIMLYVYTKFDLIFVEILRLEWFDCSATVMFVIHQLHARLGQSLNQHIVMRLSEMAIGSSLEIWGSRNLKFSLEADTCFFLKMVLLVGRLIYIYICAQDLILWILEIGNPTYFFVGWMSDSVV